MSVGIVLRDAQSADFFDATAAGRLLVKRCQNCGHVSQASTEMCPQCASVDLTFADSAGEGVIVACGVVNGRSKDGTPPSRTVVGIVELDEGPWIYTQFVDIDPDAAKIGLRVRVAFEQPEGGEAIPVFTI
ncbi:MAG: DNA-binding protein [Frankiales bacterium]|nr:DNA-binding protein [Frankiales bacterium]